MCTVTRSSYAEHHLFYSKQTDREAERASCGVLIQTKVSFACNSSREAVGSPSFRTLGRTRRLVVTVMAMGVLRMVRSPQKPVMVRK